MNHGLVARTAIVTYGHSDHIAISQFTSAALLCAADPTYRQTRPIAPLSGSSGQLRNKLLQQLLFCAVLIPTAATLFFPQPTTRAAGIGVQVWLTTPDGVNHLTPQSSRQFTPDTNTSVPTIDVDDTQQFQQIDGFGAAITDSSAWLLYNK